MRVSNQFLSADEWLLVAAATGFGTAWWSLGEDWNVCSRILLSASVLSFGIAAAGGLRLVCGAALPFSRLGETLAQRLAGNKRNSQQNELDDEAQSGDPLGGLRKACFLAILAGALLFAGALVTWVVLSISSSAERAGREVVFVLDSKWHPLNIVLVSGASVLLGCGVYLIVVSENWGKVFGAVMVSASGLLILRPDAIVNAEAFVRPEHLLHFDSLFDLNLDESVALPEQQSELRLRFLGATPPFESGAPAGDHATPDCGSLLAKVCKPVPDDIVSLTIIGGVDQTPVAAWRSDLTNRKIALSRAQLVQECMISEERVPFDVEVFLRVSGPTNVGVNL